MEVVQALDDSGSSAKRRKVGNGELRLNSSKLVRISGCESEGHVKNNNNNNNNNNNTSKNLSVEKNEDLSGDDIPASCCSIEGSIMQKLKYADLEESGESETETTVRRERLLPPKQIKIHNTLSPNSMAEESEKQPVAVVIDSRRRTIPPEKTPPADEIEAFFAAAEKDIQNRFKNKYNYDIVNDVPLKGRFEWIQLKPSN